MNDPQPSPDAIEDADIEHLLNAQAGRLSWPELQRHFARGVVLRVAADLDLIAVAAAVVRDEKPKVQTWMELGKLGKADVADARRWEATAPDFWAVVAAPWVLVQETDN